MPNVSQTTNSQSTAASKSASINRRTDLLVIHTHGRTLLLQLPKRGAEESRNIAINALAKQLGKSPAELWKRVHFAEKYDEKAMQELLAWENLKWGHVRKLLTVENKKKRSRFAAKANKRGWSPYVLACEIEAQQGVKNVGGRPTDSRPLSPGRLHELKKQADRMLHFFEKFACDYKGSRRLGKKDLELCRKILPVVLERFDELKKAIPVLMKGLVNAISSAQNAGTSAS
jgi:hypothetical protein